MMCDTCTNRQYCENEEKQMCIANNYDRYDDDGSLDLDLDDTDYYYDPEIDTVKMVFSLMVEDNPNPATSVLNSACSAVQSLVDKELGTMLVRNIFRTAERCIV